MECTEECEKFILEILAERVKRDPNGQPSFKVTDWEEMDELIFLKFAKRYGPDKVKAKYHRMRGVHSKFTDSIINNTGVTRDSNNNKVSAHDAFWDDFFKPLPGKRRVKTNSKRGEKVDALIDAWSQSIIARKERDLAKAERSRFKYGCCVKFVK